MATRMLQRRGTPAEWAADDEVLSAGEIGVSLELNGSHLLRVGDGVRPWSQLPNYVGPQGDPGVDGLDAPFYIDAEQNLRLWELEASVLNTAEGFTNWQGDGFLIGQDEVSVDGGLRVMRSARLLGGSVGIFTGNIDAWTSRTTPDTDQMYAVAWSGSLFVAVGSGGTVWTSPDGITWTSRTTPATNHMYAVAWSGSLSVAVGGGGTVLTSVDGITWTSRTTPGTTNMNGVAWSGSLFVAVGYSGAIWTSVDGITWTSRTTPDTDHMNGVAWSGSLFVAVGGDAVWTSPDGINWTSRTTPVYAFMYAVTWSGSLFVAVGYDGTALTSPDGITWTSRTTPGTDRMRGVTWSGSLFVAVGNGGTVWTSVDETTDTGTLVLNTVVLPSTATDVYLLSEETLDTNVTATYEATLDGGTTWEVVVPGSTTMLAHSGTSFALRVTLARPPGSSNEGRIFWFIGFAS